MEDIFIFLQQEYLLLAALVVLTMLFVKRESTLSGAKISVTETIQAMNAETAVLVDIREKKDFDAGHVVNAVSIPFAKISGDGKLFHQYKDKHIIIADKMGQQSGAIGKKLSKEGLNVSRLSGGMEEWKHQNLPLVK